MPARKAGVTRLRINRFTVMAMLQAARARHLELPLPSAYSWGLNRAIFYAAAKRGFQSRGAGEGGGGGGGRPPPDNLFRLGDDEAYVDPSRPGPLFTIGGETQTAEDFEKKIASRFGGAKQFEAAWREAEGIIRSFDEATLKSPRGFYDEVYRPRRDQLVVAWAEKFGPPAPS
jgi:hypothetical protein